MRIRNKQAFLWQLIDVMQRLHASVQAHALSVCVVVSYLHTVLPFSFLATNQTQQDAPSDEDRGLMQPPSLDLAWAAPHAPRLEPLHEKVRDASRLL